MKLVVALISCIVLSNHIYAADTNSYRKAMVDKEGACVALAAPKYSFDIKTNKSKVEYLVDNKTLHECTYYLSLSDLNCIDTQTCPSYSTWSQKNPNLDIKLPTATFQQRIYQYQNSKK